LRRILYGFVTLLVAVIVLFILVRLVTDNTQFYPAGYQNMKLNPEQLRELLDNRMKTFGVYGPLGAQLGTYLKNLFPLIPKDVVISEQYRVLEGGGFEIISHEVARRWVYLSITTIRGVADEGSDIMTLFNKAIPYSLAFGSVAVVFSYLIGVPLGIQAAKKKGKPSDATINGFSIGLIAIPGMVIVIGVYLLSIGLFGNSGMFSSGSFWTKFWPIVVLVLMMTPTTVILTRRYVIDEMTSDYTRFALAKGMSNDRVYYVHIFRNAGIRIIKQFPLDLAVTLFGASILTEQQWGIPGMGKIIVTAVSTKDTFVILGYTSFAAFITIFSSLISDLLMVWLDPRVKLTKN
jgi:oligopeptide transport system permease protein